ncbi:MAG: hypothetical protein WBK77_04810 [Alphaproteobacteria bacterium]
MLGTLSTVFKYASIASLAMTGLAWTGAAFGSGLPVVDGLKHYFDLNAQFSEKGAATLGHMATEAGSTISKGIEHLLA